MQNADSGGDEAPDALQAALGARVRDLREAAGLNPADFARTAHISPQYLWRLEAGRQNVSLKSLSRLSLALRVPMSALLEGIDADPKTLAKRPYNADKPDKRGKA